MRAFIKQRRGHNRHGSKTGKQVYRGQDTRIILGQAWVFDERTISRGVDKRGNPVTRANGSKHKKEGRARKILYYEIYKLNQTMKTINETRLWKQTQNGLVSQQLLGEGYMQNNTRQCVRGSPMLIKRV